MCDKKEGDDNMLATPQKLNLSRRKVVRDKRSTLFLSTSPEKLRVINEKTKKSRGISNTRYSDLYEEEHE
jgi:hypothetical protein